MNVILIIVISIFMFLYMVHYKPSWLARFLTLGIVCNECHYLDWTINYLSTTTDNDNLQLKPYEGAKGMQSIRLLGRVVLLYSSRPAP